MCLSSCAVSDSDRFEHIQASLLGEEAAGLHTFFMSTRLHEKKDIAFCLLHHQGVERRNPSVDCVAPTQSSRLPESWIWAIPKAPESKSLDSFSRLHRSEVVKASLKCRPGEYMPVNVHMYVLVLVLLCVRQGCWPSRSYP
ncbi:unnamed protein product [Protopolystoma xenopodis]|uniref:Uncharacterized protein n=1 Tax=Protopolystoma xenopodis TaxID=117903 RepID=A0A3S5CIF8_9PLAT|nr:unnamed protein product [Protopolystoma xenopodis]